MSAPSMNAKRISLGDAKRILLGCNSWEGVKSSFAPLSDDDKGYCFELLTKCFLRLDPEYKSQLENV